MTTRVLLVDDHEVVREGFRSLLNGQADFEVVGEAGDGREGIRMAQEMEPDLVIMDVSMPGLSGIDATRQITRDNPKVKVLALSMHPSQQMVAQMLQAGAAGYLIKTSALEEIVQAVRAVVAGKVYLSPDVAGGVVKEFVRSLSNGSVAASPTLSDREREVLQLVAEGQSTKEIASSLGVAAKTVETHRHNIMEKLDLHSIAELTRYAIREGLTPS